MHAGDHPAFGEGRHPPGRRSQQEPPDISAYSLRTIAAEGKGRQHGGVPCVYLLFTPSPAGVMLILTRHGAGAGEEEGRPVHPDVTILS